MPGQTSGRRLRQPSMEGRAIARPDVRPLCDGCVATVPSMEGRAIARPDHRHGPVVVPGRRRSLQWRAGQLPGQTHRLRLPGGSALPAFNGGPGNCPARLVTSGPMGITLGFNGVGNCPARVAECRAIATRSAASLQWRAGQLPGQTATPGRSPSMEGRAIARPDKRVGSVPPSMEGRAIARPDVDCARRPSMEGRAIARPDPRPAQRRRSFNGGPGNCPARRRRSGGCTDRS